MASQNRTVLAALSLGFLTVTLDASALSVALPAISESFDGSVAGLQWVSNAFVLAFAGCILSAGRFADRFGPRTMLLIGVMGLAAGSLLGAMSPTLLVLIFARVLQGISGAILVTSSYTLLAHTFGNGPERAKAFATLNFSGTIGLSSGPVIGGLLVQAVGWQSIFLLNIGVAGVLLVMLRFVDDVHETNVLTLDAPGQLLSVIMLTALAAALIQGGSNGWFGFAGIAAIIAGLALVLFVVVEHRAKNPMLALSVFRIRAFSAGTAIIGLWRCSLYGFLFFLALYFENVLMYGSAKTGLAFLPITAGPLLSNVLSSPLSSRFSPQRVAVVGMAIAASGALLLMVSGIHPPYVVIAIGLFLMGVGAGGGIPAVGNVALAGAAKSHVGVASGVFNAGGQTGSLIGVAVIGGFAAHATTSGFHSAASVVFIALLASVVLSARYIRPVA